MRTVSRILTSVLVLLFGLLQWGGGEAAFGTAQLEALGGKAEHCALAVGMIAGGILGLIANPLLGAVAIGFMTAGLVWLTTCE